MIRRVLLLGIIERRPDILTLAADVEEGLDHVSGEREIVENEM